MVRDVNADTQGTNPSGEVVGGQVNADTHSLSPPESGGSGQHANTQGWNHPDS